MKHLEKSQARRHLGAGVLPTGHDYAGCSLIVTTAMATLQASDGAVLYCLPLEMPTVLRGSRDKPTCRAESSRRPAGGAGEQGGRLDTDTDDGEPAEVLAGVPSPEDYLAWYRRLINAFPLLTAEQEVELAERIEAGLFAEHLLSTGATTAGATVEELRAVADAGRAAKEQMVEANLRLVLDTVMSGRWTRRMAPEDLIQAGNRGLLRAVEGFDYRLGNKFSTYATMWIEQAIRRTVASDSRNVRLPEHRHNALVKLATTRAVLRDELSREPNPTELADALSWTVSEVEESLLLEPSPGSLDVLVATSFVGGEPAEWQAVGELVVDDAPAAADLVSRALLVHELAAVVDQLEPLQRRVIRLRFGLQGRPATLVEAAAALGLDPVTVRRIEVAAILALRQVSETGRLDGYLAA